MSNKGIYSVGKDLVKQNITFCQIESFVGPSQVSFTHETVTKNLAWHDSSFFSHVLYTWRFLWVASRETVASQSRNPLVQLLKLDLSLISHIHPLQLIPHTFKEND